MSDLQLILKSTIRPVNKHFVVAFVFYMNTITANFLFFSMSTIHPILFVSLSSAI